MTVSVSRRARWRTAPLRLARLHRAHEPGTTLDLTFTGGAVPAAEVEDLLHGAGFVDVVVRRERACARRARTLPDYVAPGLALLVCGLNPSLHAADAGVGFAGPGNRFWPAALAAGIVGVARDPIAALRDHHVGMTDLVKRATRGASELTADEYRAGAARLARVVSRIRPATVCFVGVTGYRIAIDRHAAAGVQAGDFAGARAYVMPNPSGINTGTSLATLAQHLRAAAT